MKQTDGRTDNTASHKTDHLREHRVVGGWTEPGESEHAVELLFVFKPDGLVPVPDMTFNVFGGTLNAAQSNPMAW